MNRFFTWEKIKHFVNIASIILAIVLSPLTVLILLSQNSIPGNFLYAYKRGLENTIVAVASVHPATRVAFRTGLTERRFDEAQTLLSSTQDINGLQEFVREVAATNKELESIADSKDKKQLEEKLYASLDDYQKRLKETKVVLIAEGKMQETIIATVPPLENAGQQQPGFPTNTPVSFTTAMSPTSMPMSTITIASTATPMLEPVLPTSTAAPGRPTSTPRPTATPHPSPRPTATSTPRPISTLTPTPTPGSVSGPTTPGDAVDKTEQYLECLRRKRENPALVCIPPFGVSQFSKDIEPSPTTLPFVPTVTPLPTATPQPTITPRPTDTETDRKEKEKKKGEKVKGANTEVDPFIELFDWVITPFVVK